MTDQKKPTPEPKAVKEVRHEFTEVQLETLTPVLKEYQAIQDKISFFLDHVRRESKLPPCITGRYNLEIDKQTGTPYLLGQVVVEKEAKA